MTGLYCLIHLVTLLKFFSSLKISLTLWKHVRDSWYGAMMGFFFYIINTILRAFIFFIKSYKNTSCSPTQRNHFVDILSLLAESYGPNLKFFASKWWRSNLNDNAWGSLNQIKKAIRQVDNARTIFCRL